MLLENGFILGLDASIVDLDDTRIVADNLKIQTILENPPILGLMCGDFGATENLVDDLKSTATSNASMKALVDSRTSFVNQDHGWVALSTYICYIEDGVPSSYIFYFVPDFNHDKECKEDYSCKCPRVGIRRGARKLQYDVVYNDGSSASDEHYHLSSPFYDGNRAKNVDTADDYKIVNIKRKLKMNLKQVTRITLFAMLYACLEDNDCGAPFRLCSFSTGGKVEIKAPYGFIETYLEFYEGLKEANTLFLIYNKRLEGSNFGHFVVEHIPIVRAKLKYERHQVALLEEDLCLHHLTFEDEKDVDAV
ncbi:hypothetical protein ACFX2I_038683 [Malus domestica]